MTDPQGPDCRFVLVGTSHSGNLGATARAMRTMALDHLVLVAPQCRVDDQAMAMAAHADTVLANADHHDDLAHAVADTRLCLGLTARPRRDGVPALTPREAAATIAAESGSVAVLFGRERTGLTNAELASCHRLVHIPANPDYPALNLAAAVQIMAYEVFMARAGTVDVGTGTGEGATPFATGEHLEGLHGQLEYLADASGYTRRGPREIMLRRLRNFINRARPTVDEVDLLRGLLKRLRP
ncbi:RNA methyltransferase [Spiribacter vilamensis]|uniref:tRNA (cytidine/uridine-2'-O-)-methyltransferase TrmJ n=1 Tax=Spiribacter vilamensis TaxID=531306 RepID=A0A4Q8D0M8_9GAMM|nr:RNA methyltransferase [Spiribacter vilamensis]RZU98901.1 tRNA (cytidine32/uridine32-2'-O)-methyltransferase [Spiribacter vilamensis]